MKFRQFHILFLSTFAAVGLRAQSGNTGVGQSARKSDYWNWHKKGNWYFSWGYSKWWYPKTDLHFDINNDDANARSNHSVYTLKDVYVHDTPFINKIFVMPITVPQFCVRVGYFFNSDQTLGAEFTYDHAKFVVDVDQHVEMVGTTNGVAFDSTAHLYPEFSMGPQPFVFKLNNGANFFEFNLVKKFTLFESKHRNFRLFYLFKGGAGWNTPHVQNTIFGVENKPHFQAIGGWNAGVEGALRMLLFNRVYLEFGQKAVYAAYYNLRLAQGTASVHFATHGNILSLGMNFPERMTRQYTSTNAE
ncbi:MAG TPA: hypothetical protein VL651_17460 [Bacteroidia bacterium]|jgi:hypothetical protein|nr:hypothetical protein [Bacteroidia bacterium]